MIQRFCITPPELSPANGNERRFEFGVRATRVRVWCTFVAEVEVHDDMGNVRRVSSPMVPHFTMHMPRGRHAKYVVVRLPGSWSALTEFASMHGWCFIEGLEDGIEPQPLTPENMLNFRWNIHTTLGAGVQTSNIMVEGVAGFETAAEHNGRIPDILFLNHVAIWTHGPGSGDVTPITHNVQTVALIRVAVNPVGIPEDTMSLFALAAPNAIGSWGYSFAAPLPFPLRSCFRTYNAGDATPSLNLVYSHAAAAPANTVATCQMQCSGIMIP